MNVRDIMRLIDEATEPVKMSKAEAVEFLERIETEIEMRKEALREEMDE